MTQSDTDSTQERRDFFRLKFNSPVQFKTYSEQSGSSRQTSGEQAQTAEAGTSKNISSAGILFRTTKRPPQLSSVLWLSLDYRMLKICQEIEQRALIFKDGILGRVVRVEENPENSEAYDVGVCFLTKEQRNSRAVQNAIPEISQSGT